MHMVDYPVGETSMTMIAHVSSSKGYFAWLSKNLYLFITESLTSAHLWVNLMDPLLQHRFRYDQIQIFRCVQTSL